LSAPLCDDEEEAKNFSSSSSSPHQRRGVFFFSLGLCDALLSFSLIAGKSNNKKRDSHTVDIAVAVDGSPVFVCLDHQHCAARAV
jgi:hypothetical protein